VRVEYECAHAVVDSGASAVVRHLFHAADPLIFVGLGLWLDSYVAVLFAIVPVALIMLRLGQAEWNLQREYPGYRAYMLRVTHRRIPGDW
jgi:protein-S-isoprenylcysteine O-methyltransferase Ste14